MNKFTLAATLSLAVVLILGGQAFANTIVNGDFAIYKAGTDIRSTVMPGNGWVNGMGYDLPISRGPITFADGSVLDVGDLVDIPGWTTPITLPQWRDGADFTTANVQAFSSGYDPTDGTSVLNAFGAWSGQNGNLATSADPVPLPAGAGPYVLSAMFLGNPLPYTFDLLLDGEVLTPDASTDPPDEGAYREVTRTYNTIPAGDLRVLVGTTPPHTTAEDDPDRLSGTRLRVDNISFIASSPFHPTDFDQDGSSDLVDINALTASADLPEGLPAALAGPQYDLTGDDMVNGADLDQWLIDAAPINGFGSPYLKGDANLDGDVDVFAIDGSGDAQILSSNLGTETGAVWGDGDFNGDGDVDVFAIDGSGDAQLLSSNLGSSSDAAPDTAEAIYDAATGELTFDVGTGIAVIGVQAEGLDHAAVDTESALGAPAQNGGGILAYFSASGLPAVMASVGNVLPRGMTAEEIGFSFTPIGGESTVVPVTVIVPEPSTIAMLLVLGAIALCWRKRSA